MFFFRINSIFNQFIDRLHWTEQQKKKKKEIVEVKKQEERKEHRIKCNVYKSINLPELKCERFVVPFSVSLSSGRLRESPISGLGHVSIPASGSAAISTINPQFIRTLLAIAQYIILYEGGGRGGGESKKYAQA